MNRDEIKKELEELQSSLDMEDKREHYQIPDDYFDNMQQEVLGRIKKEKRSQGMIMGLSGRKNVLNRIMASAAILILLIGAFIVFDQYNAGQDSFENLDAESIYAYLNDNIEDISMEMLTGDDTELMPSFDMIEDGELQDYIEENLDDIDLEDLEDIL